MTDSARHYRVDLYAAPERTCACGQVFNEQHLRDIGRDDRADAYRDVLAEEARAIAKHEAAVADYNVAADHSVMKTHPEYDADIAAAEAKLGIIHKDGVSWFDAPAPPKHHAHWVQTSGLIRGDIKRIERCPCGAIRHEGERWLLLDEPRVAPVTAKKRKWLPW
jgi:hypothetical protein